MAQVTATGLIALLLKPLPPTLLHPVPCSLSPTHGPRDLFKPNSQWQPQQFRSPGGKGEVPTILKDAQHHCSHADVLFLKHTWGSPYKCQVAKSRRYFQLSHLVGLFSTHWEFC